MAESSNSLLESGEPGPYELIRPAGTSPIVLVCDHASNRIPARLNSLGLNAEQLASHIAWDPGAAKLARKLSSRLDAALILSNYSRLVIDCNRPPGHPASIARSSDNVIVPGNSQVNELEARRRQATLFDPYHRAIGELLRRRTQHGTRLLSIHSFTPALAGVERPWAIGVCYLSSVDWARQMRAALNARSNEQIGNNEPYDVDIETDYTLPVHGDRHGIPNLMLELRQDQLADDASIQQWCDIIAGCCSSP